MKIKCLSMALVQFILTRGQDRVKFAEKYEFRKRFAHLEFIRTIYME